MGYSPLAKHAEVWTSSWVGRRVTVGKAFKTPQLEESVPIADGLFDSWKSNNMQRLLLRGIRLFSSSTAAAAASPKPPLKLLPAGNTDIAAFVNPRDNLFYVDKAAFIPDVEKAAKVTVLLRPKRWGKSTFLNLLASYYDSAATQLVHVPAGNSPSAHSMTILKLDLANVARSLSAGVTEMDLHAQVTATLDAEVRLAVADAADRYNIPNLDITQPPSELLRKTGRWAASHGAPLYVLVDEYDAALRTLAISSGEHALSALAGRQGPLREFFGRLKYMVDSGLAARVFMTGRWHTIVQLLSVLCTLQATPFRHIPCWPGINDHGLQHHYRLVAKAFVQCGRGFHAR